jgi:hypothetical protein
MMADEQLTTFKLNLDAEEFTKGLESIKTTLEGLGKEGSLEGLVTGLGKVAEISAVVGTAALALKTSLDLVFDAEKIKQTELAFETLTKSVGIASEELRAGLVEASNGLIGENELLQSANKAIVTMGASASKLPEVMELARKATLVFGGDLQSNFEQMNQAIASGNTRMLKHMGIIVDASKAYEDFARANGISVSAMSEAAKQQAILNAVLDYGRQRFAGINGDTMQATSSWTQLKVALKDTGEAIALVFDRILGPTLTKFIQMTADATRSFKNFLLMVGGSEEEKAKAHIDDINQSVGFLKKSIDELEKQKLTVTDPEQLAAINKEIAAQKAIIDSSAKSVEGYKTQLKELGEQKPTGPQLPSQAAPSLIDPEKQKAEQAKFQSEMLRFHTERIKQELAVSKNQVEQDALYNDLKIQAKKEAEAKILEIESSKEFSPAEKAKLKEELLLEAAKKEEAIDQERLKKKQQFYDDQLKMADDMDQAEELLRQKRQALEEDHELRKKQINENDLLDDQQKKQALLQEEQNFQNQIYQIQEQRFNESNRVVDNWVKHADGAAQQFGRGFAANSLRAKNSLNDFASQGNKAFGILSSHMESAFERLGEGAESASDVMRSAMMGMIADIAEAYGKMALEAGLVPPNPVYLAAGAALLALSGYLRGQAKGKGGGAGAGGSGGGGGADVSGMGALGGAPSANAEGTNVDQRQAKAVHLEIHGSVLDSEATATRIAELVRQSADATDFRIAKVGGGI